MTLLGIIFMLIISATATFGLWGLSNKKIKYSLILIFTAIFIFNYGYGLVGVIMALIFTFPYILWCNNLRKNKFKKKSFLITLIVALAYTSLQLFGLILKIILQKNTPEIFTKFALVLVGIFFVSSLFELRKLTDYSFENNRV